MIIVYDDDTDEQIGEFGLIKDAKQYCDQEGMGTSDAFILLYEDNGIDEEIVAIYYNGDLYVRQ